METVERQLIKSKCLEESKRSAKIASLLVNMSYEDFLDSCIGAHKYYAKIKGLDFNAVSHDSFWEYEDQVYSEAKDVAWKMFVSIFENTIINYYYVYNKARELGISPSEFENKEEFIKHVFYNIPKIYNFQNEFDASLRKRSEIGNFPVIVVYKFLFGVLQQLVHNFVWHTLFMYEEKITLRSQEHIINESRNPVNSPIFINMIKGLCGQSSIMLASKKLGDEVKIPYTIVYGYASNFVMLHEYGHFFLGHLNSGKKRLQIELEADRFAFYCIFRDLTKSYMSIEFGMIALVSVFGATFISELINGEPIGEYANGFQRFQSLGQDLTEPQQALYKAWWNKFALLLNPTLQSNFNKNIPSL